MASSLEAFSLLPQFVLLALAIVLALGFIWFCGWDAKRRLRDFAITDAKDRANVFDAFRKTTAQVIGAGAVVILFAYTFTKDNLSYEQARSQAAASMYAEGVKLLKDTEATGRTGGIYLVEKVAALDTTYRDPIARTLVAFIMAKKPVDRQRPPGLAAEDVQAAILTLGRTARIPENDRFALNLDAASLARMDFSYLDGFRGRRLQGADLRVANFVHADLSEARLSGVEMSDYKAFGPEFDDNVPRKSTWYFEKYWYGVAFDCANLTGTQIDGASLSGALFGRADLTGTNFDRSNLSRAEFDQARNLDKANFGDACADTPPVFPAGFTCQLRRCTTPEGGPLAKCSFSGPASPAKERAKSAACGADAAIRKKSG